MEQPVLFAKLLELRFDYPQHPAASAAARDGPAGCVGSSARRGASARSRRSARARRRRATSRGRRGSGRLRCRYGWSRPEAPKIPILTPWVSHEKAVENLRRAIAVNGRNLVNRHFLAEALADGNPAERAEGIAIEEAVVADAPSPGHLVEELAIQEEARKNLAKWKK